MTEFRRTLVDFVCQGVATRNEQRPDTRPSVYWSDFSRNFRYVYELGEDELLRIRYHTYHLTSDIYLTYYFASDAYRRLLVDGYNYFVKGWGLVPLDEGEYGIGIDTDCGRISHDLLRYLGAFCDIKESGLIDGNAGRVAMELGGGYGGLAKVHLTQVPSISYIICDLEETLFFSAIYLAKYFGENRIHLIDSLLAEESLRPGHVYIVPQSRIELLDRIRIDYAISQQSLQEMTSSQVCFYLRWLLGHARYLYTCNIDSHGNLALEKHLITNLSEAIANVFGTPVWVGSNPTSDCRFGDNHLPRRVFKCSKQ